MNKIFLTIIIIIGIAHQSFAKYDVNENCKNAWMLLMDLKIDEAKELLAYEIITNPDNYYAYYLDQTCDAYRLQINSDEEAYEDFVDNYYDKREIMDEKDMDSPYYLSCSSDMELQVGIFNIIYGSTLSGLRKAYSAYRNVYKNLEIHPEFGPGLKMDGFFNVAISNLPPFVKWAASFFGVTSDIDYGFTVLEDNYISQKDIRGINAESALFVILAAKINKTPELVYDFSNSLDSSISQTFIHSYFRANIAYRIGENEEALESIRQIDISEHAFADIIYNYMLGKILLRKLDPDAGKHLSRYLNNLQKKEYLKEINYNLGLFYLLNDDDTLKYLNYCEIVREKGMDINERDREALYDASLDYFPDINLAKARLLLDGSYYERYKKTIASYEANSSDILAHKIEYLYLEARFNAANSNNKLAIEQFKKVIKLGEDKEYYFASEAALRLGNIYYDMGMIDIARDYYQKSIKLYKKEYYEYIEDKAVKALNKTKSN